MIYLLTFSQVIVEKPTGPYHNPIFDFDVGVEHELGKYY
jgi:hypothetical protein